MEDIKTPLSEDQKEKVWDEINDIFDPEFNDYNSLCEWVCEKHGITIKDIE